MSFKGCEMLGVGLGFRHPYYLDMLDEENHNLIDWLEYTPENYMNIGGRPNKQLADVSKIYPLVSHGVSLSIGSCDELSSQYIADLKGLFKDYPPKWFSDHLCFSSVDGDYFNDLIPLLRTESMIQKIVDKIKYLQNEFQIPFLIENASFYLTYEGHEYSEEDFINEILTRSDCGMLLDVNNIYVNSKNHKFDPYKYLDNLALDHTVQMHIAGHTHYPEAIIDTHGEAVCDDVWDLLAYTLERVPAKGIMIERDSNLPPWHELKDELIKLRHYWKKYRLKQAADTEKPELI